MNSPSRMAERAAASDITDPDKLRDLGADPWSELARALSNLDAACHGEQIAMDAILTALSQYQTKAKWARYAEIKQEFVEDFV